MNAPPQPSPGRASVLPMMLGSIVLVFGLLFLMLITAGFFFYFLLVIACIVSLGMMHFYLWGKALEDQTAGWREEEKLLERVQQGKSETRTWTPRS